MMIMDRYLLKQFLPIFLSALALFMMLVILIDLFLHLTRYLDNGAGLFAILKVSLYFVPKSFLYALPVSLLFASAYTLGDLSSKNELTVVLGSGTPYGRFCLPLLVLGIVSSLFAFFFEDRAVIPSLKRKNELSRELLHTNDSALSNIVIKLNGGKLIYLVDYYDTLSETINEITIVELDDEYSLRSVVYSGRAVWQGDSWAFSNPLVYEWNEGFFKPRPAGNMEKYNEDPETFRRSSVMPEDLNARDTARLIKDLKRAGLPYASAQADYYHRFSFSAVSFVVIFLSLTVSGRFKKNILLLSLLASLGTAVVFYVVEMISMMSARAGLLAPVLGAWIPVFACTAAGFLLLRHART
ncbi:MAG: LptF/LptG family permease [Spirochaetaceae bacterium]|jgi:lipopolysaccharide export system permease protein|nr:LptF/LptG family permease [Spirochaetaceae bacterium]